MKLKSFLLAAVACSAFAISSAHASLLISYNTTSLGLFSDTGSLITSYSTSLVNPQGVAIDNSGNVYVAEFGTPGLFDGNVKMYDLVSGAFIRNVVAGSYNFTGLAFNPANAGEIIVVGQYAAGASQLGRWNTNATGSAAAVNSGLGSGYTGAFTDGTNIYLGNPALSGIIQSFDSTALSGGAVVFGNPFTPAGNPSGITGFGGERYYTTVQGDIYRQSSTTALMTGQGGLYGVTNDGTNLWVADYTTGGGRVSQITTAGGLVSSFNLANAAYIAYIPEPSSAGLITLTGLALAGIRRRRNA